MLNSERYLSRNNATFNAMAWGKARLAKHAKVRESNVFTNIRTLTVVVHGTPFAKRCIHCIDL